MIQIITDSISDIRQAEAKALKITVVPLHVIFGMYSYLDDMTITREDFYRRLEAGELPKTSQAAPDSFAKCFAKAIAAGDEVVCINGSSKVSGTYQSAVIARDMQEQPERIHLVDSLSGNVGQALLVHEAIRQRDAGMTAPQLVQHIQSLIPRVRLSAQVENLKHLVLGGRVSAGAARVGDLLHLKPVLSIIDGAVQQQGMIHGRKKALQWFAGKLTAEAPFDPAYPVYIASCNAPAALAQLRGTLEARGVAPASLYEMEVGSVIGTHTGPGCLTMAWIEQE